MKSIFAREEQVIKKLKAIQEYETLLYLFQQENLR